jgi:hypothetical protein
MVSEQDSSHSGILLDHAAVQLRSVSLAGPSSPR